MDYTVKDTLKGKVSYPLPDAFYEEVIKTRGLNGDELFTGAIGVSGSYRLAYADCLIRHATIISVSEGGTSVNAPQEVKVLLALANSIYRQNGEAEVSFDTEPEATVTYHGESWD